MVKENISVIQIRKHKRNQLELKDVFNPVRSGLFYREYLDVAKNIFNVLKYLFAQEI